MPRLFGLSGVSNFWYMKKVIFYLVFSIISPFLLGLLFVGGFEGKIFTSIPLHSVVECLGGTIALIIAAILFYENNLKQSYKYIFVVAALISMGITDIFHAIVPPGNLFVWFHSIAQFLGGLFFAMIMVVRIEDLPKQKFFIISVIVGSILLGLHGLLSPDSIPKMVDFGEFTFLAKILNVSGGVGFLVASVFFLINHLKYDEEED